MKVKNPMAQQQQMIRWKTMQNLDVQTESANGKTDSKNITEQKLQTRILINMRTLCLSLEITTNT